MELTQNLSILFSIVFMLGWPNILNYMNNNQHGALFIFSLLSYYTSTRFGRIDGPSSGGRMYICGKLYLLYCTVDCQRAWPQYNKYHLPHVYILLPDDGLLIRPKHVEVS
jgi:hypothetical protein